MFFFNYYFWLRSVFIVVRGLSLVVPGWDYSPGVVCGLPIAVAPLAGLWGADVSSCVRELSGAEDWERASGRDRDPNNAKISLINRKKCLFSLLCFKIPAGSLALDDKVQIP